jgi:chromosome segregation ATPase
MSEAEQAINVSRWKELHAELEEVSDKRNRLQAENNRLKALIQLTQKECDEAKNYLRDMTAERQAARKFADDTQAELAQAKEVADMFEQENDSLRDTVQQLRAKQIHDDLPGILMVIQKAAEQARELI